MNATRLLVAARWVYISSPDHSPEGVRCPNGKYCPVLALEEVTSSSYGRETFREALNALGVAAGLAPEEWPCVTGEPYRQPVIRWNAESSTEEVLAAFDRAIEATS